MSDFGSGGFAFKRPKKLSSDAPLPRFRKNPLEQFFSFLAGLGSGFVRSLGGFLLFVFAQRDFHLLTASAFLAALSMPGWGFDFGFLAWFALVPAFTVILQRERLLPAFGSAFWCGFVFNALGFRFLLGINPLAWLGLGATESLLASVFALLFAGCVSALVWGVFALLVVLAQRVQSTNFFTPWQLALLWVLLAFFLGTELLPWNPLHLSQASNITLIQVSDVLGASAIDFVLIFSNLCLALLCRELLQREGQARFFSAVPVKTKNIIALTSLNGGALLVLLVFFHAYGFISLATQRALLAGSASLQLTAFQINLTPNAIRLKSEGANLYEPLIVRELNRSEPRLFVMPEGALRLEQLPLLVSKFPAQSFLLGSYPEEGNKSYNAAVLLKGNEPAQYYQKRKLVPFGESYPAAWLYGGLLKSLGLSFLTENAFTAGHPNPLLLYGSRQLGGAICFEAAFPGIFAGQSKRGAEAFVLLGDISWFQRASLLPLVQMRAHGIFRAIENRRAVVMVVNGARSINISSLGFASEAQLSLLPSSEDVSLGLSQSSSIFVNNPLLY